MSASWDLVLSSGFLAFARHAGFLLAIEQRGLPVGAVCGTSSGALIGALWAAGHRGPALASALETAAPWRFLRPPRRPWRGAFSTRALERWLSQRLPPSFAELEIPLGVGVRDARGEHALVTDGTLAAAVTASCAMPGVFEPVAVSAKEYQDGGAVDRLGLRAWMAHRGARPTVVHWIERTAGVDTELPSADGAPRHIVRSPRSRASFFSLGDFAGQIERTRQAAFTQLDPVVAKTRS